MYTCNLIVCVILTAIPVYNSTAGCNINGSNPCGENSRLLESGKCEACEAGRYGCNCSLLCANNTFGVGCYSTCNCSADEICDPATGCTSNTNVSSYTTDSSDLPGSSPVRSIQDSHKNNRLNKFPLSLLVSSATVVFFSIVCAAILIRLNKRVYQREYKKLVNNLHMAETRRTEDDPEYASYNYTDSSIFSNSLRHSNEENTYDHSERGSYNILSLRTRSSMVNENDEGCDVPSCSQNLKSKS
ncbi:uncharacterized protein LOC125653181 isoform X2 [Ostrea edulis]|uniref:uncharacterized protein LOC125653181 isoform X2 n=1 Tax=Ostrea edulis TaxID=37623 RepID=UPI0024AF84C5|nr:uncharacterized protein LOC125653181 isoform X2 [Ostrea edulis]